MAEALFFPARAVLTVVGGPVSIAETSAEPVEIVEAQGPPPAAWVPEPPAPPRPRPPAAKIDLRNAPSSMEQRAESWRGKA